MAAATKELNEWSKKAEIDVTDYVATMFPRAKKRYKLAKASVIAEANPRPFVANAVADAQAMIKRVGMYDPSTCASSPHLGCQILEAAKRVESEGVALSDFLQRGFNFNADIVSIRHRTAVFAEAVATLQVYKAKAFRQQADQPMLDPMKVWTGSKEALEAARFAAFMATCQQLALIDQVRAVLLTFPAALAQAMLEDINNRRRTSAQALEEALIINRLKVSIHEPIEEV